jgi:hypothetical protein
MAGGGRKPGVRYGGRAKGTKNKLSRDIKETFIKAFHDLQLIKGVNLTDWAKANPELFYPLAARLIPKELAGDPDNPIRVDLSGQVNLYMPDNGRAKPDNQPVPKKGTT